MESIPLQIELLFWVTTLTTLLLFYWVLSNTEHDRYKSNLILMGLSGWLILQAIFAREELFSSKMDAIPPMIATLGIIPPLLLIFILFISRNGRRFIDQLPAKGLIIIHVVRVPVEITLYYLFVQNLIPELMTFAGRNFDIMAGLTAPLMLLAIKKRILLFLWNLISLGLLINIVINAFLSAPTPLQQFGFDQPNIAVLYFPYAWLPTFIVPVVLFCHLASLRQLTRKSIIK